ALMPLRTTSWSSTIITRRGTVIVVMFAHHRVVLFGWTRASGRREGRRRPILDGIGHALHEVPDGRLGDAVEEHSIQGAAQRAKRRLVASAEADLGQVLAQGRGFDLRL